MSAATAARVLVVEYDVVFCVRHLFHVRPPEPETALSRFDRAPLRCLRHRRHAFQTDQKVERSRPQTIVLFNYNQIKHFGQLYNKFIVILE